MEKIIILLALPFLLSSCFEEEPLPGFMNKTIWSSYILGTDTDENGQYSYKETHSLKFGEKTYVHTMERQETEGGGSYYKPVLQDTILGTYVIDYPEIIMTENGREMIGTMSIDGVMVVDRENKQRLFFSKNK
ncbi:MAG: hypothetical protein LBI58_02060 [Tannerellaceae bacterium]|jgi:hypothetical protein|nr:hypothetical protein [Tannerellaceae bacterium]